MKTTKGFKRARDWPRADIIAALHKRGLSLRQLAKIHGCGVSTLSMALRGPAAPSEDIIAAALGVSPATLWPSRFNPDGTRLDLRQQSRCPCCGHVYSRSGNEAVSVKHTNTKAHTKPKAGLVEHGEAKQPPAVKSGSGSKGGEGGGGG